MTTGEYLKSLRKAKGLTQIEVAEAVGIAVNSLRLYEADKRVPKANVYEKLVNYYKPFVDGIDNFYLKDSTYNKYFNMDAAVFGERLADIITPYLKIARQMDEEYNGARGNDDSVKPYNPKNTRVINIIISNALTQLESNLELIFGKESSLSDSEEQE